jgi:hypothetical protein
MDAELITNMTTTNHKISKRQKKNLKKQQQKDVIPIERTADHSIEKSSPKQMTGGSKLLI